MEVKMKLQNGYALVAEMYEYDKGKTELAIYIRDEEKAVITQDLVRIEPQNEHDVSVKIYGDPTIEDFTNDFSIRYDYDNQLQLCLEDVFSIKSPKAELYSKKYGYEEMKIMMEIGKTITKREKEHDEYYDYESIINITSAIYKVWNNQFNVSFLEEYKYLIDKYPELKIANNEEMGYSQVYAIRTANTFFELYQKCQEDLL